MNRLERAKLMRQQYEASVNAVRKMIDVEDLLPEDLDGIKELYPSYRLEENYLVGDVFKLNGGLYKVRQDHTSTPELIPSAEPDLYLQVIPESEINPAD